jgi:aryl-alcohol dehydrogenase-like predicted oxidoreductase
VSQLCLGTMTFGTSWGMGAPIEDCEKILNYYSAQGGNFIDTADFYGNGESEEIVGDLIKSDRHRWVLASKYSLATDMGNVNGAGNHRKHMIHSIDQSLKRLKTDYIDLYYVHCWDGITPVEETMRALDDLVRSGKILYIGISDTPAWIAAKCNMLAELRGWSQFISLEIPYNLIERTVERELLPMARDMGMSVVSWGPLAEGLLTGKYLEANTIKTDRNIRLTERNVTIVTELFSCAREIGVSPSQLALKWLLDQDTAIIPIVGARKVEQLIDNLKSLDVIIPEHISRRLDKVSKIDYGFPFEFFERQKHLDLYYAGMLDKLDIKRNSAYNYTFKD